MSTPRRTAVTTVLGGAVGAALALFSATRTWSLTVTARPGLSDLRTARTGAEAAPWLLALALVALAGAAAVPAVRGAPRRLLGMLLTLDGVLLAVGAVVTRAGLDAGRAGTAATGWTAGCVLGAVTVAVGGVVVARYGHRWPAMGARYERPGRAGPPGAGGTDRGEPLSPGEPPPAAGQPAATPVNTREAWDALDRGEDPTVR